MSGSPGYDTGYGYGGVAPTPPTPPPPPEPSAFDTSIQDLIDLITKNSGAYGELSGQLKDVAGNMGGVADEFGNIAAGNDPAFQRARDARLALLKANTTAQVGEVGDFYGGRGLGGSSADLNARIRVMQGAGVQEQNVAADLDLQQLNRQFSALQGREGALGGQAGVLSGSLDPITAMLSLGAIPPALQAQMEAAKNAGKGGGSGGGSDSPCCFIVLEATDGLLPEVIRRYRDEHCGIDGFNESLGSGNITPRLSVRTFLESVAVVDCHSFDT